MKSKVQNPQPSLSSSSQLSVISSQSSQSARTIGSNPTQSPAHSTFPLLERQTRTLPFELQEHVTIYFEEGLYSQALNLLKALLISGNTSAAKRPAILPPASHLALIATLAVHPTHTTRAKSLDRLEVANLALQYLQLVLHHVGPQPKVLGEAFMFTRQNAVSRRGTSTRRRTTGEGISPASDKSDSIENELANAGSIWASAENFWHIVGWSFNCSVSYKRRWNRWSAWLAILIELLEGDWEARCRYPEHESKSLSLIVKYINAGNGVAGKERRILRAVFADGRPKSMKEFCEVWPHETKELKRDDGVKKAEAKIDIEADNYGDYLEDENDSDLESSTSERALSLENGDHGSASCNLNVMKDFGGIESINLRIRLLSLLSKVSLALPDTFTDINTLYHIFYEHIRPLPMPAFFALVSPSGLRLFEPKAASTLTQYILRSMIATAAPLPPNDDMSQDVLETSYLPFPANTNSVIDNTKVSLCVETLLRLIDKELGLRWTPELQKLSEIGIKARATKARGKRTKKMASGDGLCDGSWLAASAERISMTVKFAKP